MALSGCATAQYNDVEGAPIIAPSPPPPPPPPVNPPPQFQFLYGSGEAAALSIQAYQTMANYAVAATKARPGSSAVLTPEGTLQAPEWVSCGQKPFAVVLDADETALLNLGVEEKAARAPDAPFDEKQWDRWERTGDKAVAAVPGAVAAFAQMRAAGITIIFNTNRSATTADGTERALAFAGLGAFRHGETLFLRGDVDGKGPKDGRRAAIAAKYCVVAMAGDQLGDFSDRFALGTDVVSRRRVVMDSEIAEQWGQGWFVLPNPVYGAGLKGSYEDVFPADTRWSDPADGARP